MYGYPNYYQPQDQLQQLRTMPTMSQTQAGSIVWVQGEGGAKSYMVPAGGTALLMDSEARKFYIKSTDMSGMPMPLRRFSYSEETDAATAEYATKEELKQLEERLAQMLKTDNGEEFEK